MYLFRNNQRGSGGQRIINVEKLNFCWHVYILCSAFNIYGGGDISLFSLVTLSVDSCRCLHLELYFKSALNAHQNL